MNKSFETPQLPDVLDRRDDSHPDLPPLRPGRRLHRAQAGHPAHAPTRVRVRAPARRRNLRQIQELLGRKHLDSTQRYTRVTAREVRGAVKRLRFPERQGHARAAVAS
jgi:hypothetical protein